MSQTYKVTAPTRADLAGGTLDLWPLYCFVGGARTINVALDMPAVVEVTLVPSAGFELTLVNAASPETERWTLAGPLPSEALTQVPALVRFPVAVASDWLAGRKELPRAKATFTITTTVPPQSGLGGSSTLCVAVARALARLVPEETDPRWQYRTLDWVKDTEAKYLQMLTGTQDYLAAIFGGLASYRFDLGWLERTTYREDVTQGLAERMMILYSGELHESGSSNWEIVRKTVEKDPRTLRGLAAIRDIAEHVHELLSAPTTDWTALGRAIRDEWRTRKELFNVTTARLDEIFDFLDGQPIYGAKVCGAAQGGSLLVLVDPERKDAVAESCRRSGIQVLAAKLAKNGVAVG
jgi:D-glycero-alpha-D-manno-heptose-7-phosphate kinase